MSRKASNHLQMSIYKQHFLQRSSPRHSIQFKVDRLQMIVVAKNLSVLRLPVAFCTPTHQNQHDFNIEGGGGGGKSACVLQHLWPSL